MFFASTPSSTCYVSHSSLVFKHGSWQGFGATSVDYGSAGATDDDENDEPVLQEEEDCTETFDDAGFRAWYLDHA